MNVIGGDWSGGVHVASYCLGASLIRAGFSNMTAFLLYLRLKSHLLYEYGLETYTG